MGRVARRKVLRDLWLARGRTAVLVFAMAASLTALGAVLGAYGILAREMPRSSSTRPMSTSADGVAIRSLTSGSRLWPPARSFAPG